MAQGNAANAPAPMATSWAKMGDSASLRVDVFFISSSGSYGVLNILFASHASIQLGVL